jgi:two-component system KDP operon response regulator KdpE
MGRPRILIIDDDVMLSNLLGMLLDSDGFEVASAGSGQAGLKLAEEFGPDAIILDIRMPGMDGFEVCRRLREIMDPVIVFASVKGKPEDIVRGLQVGGDDYVVKPYTYQELSSRLMACLRRRRAGMPPSVMEATGEVMLVADHERRLVFIGDGEVQLTPTEFDVLRYLMKNEGRVLSMDAILANAWGPEYVGDHSLVKQFVYRLRNKLEPEPSEPHYIVTVRGSGYVFEGSSS